MAIVHTKLVGPFGQYRTEPIYFDLMIQKYLPSSVVKLRQILIERGADPQHAAALKTVTECLFVLAEYDGFGQ